MLFMYILLPTKFQKVPNLGVTRDGGQLKK